MNIVNVRVSYIRPQYKNLQEWMKDKNNVYIGRKRIVFIDGERFPKNDSPFANPFKGERAIEKFEEYIKEKIKKNEVNLEDLRGKTLGCWCKPKDCHGDILIKLLT